MSSASPFSSLWSRAAKKNVAKVKSLPPSVLDADMNKPKSPLDSHRRVSPGVEKTSLTSIADNEMSDIKKENERRGRSARVEAGEVAKATRKDTSYSARATASDGAKRTGSLADRGTVAKGRSYWHPDRIAERSVKSRTRYERSRFG